MSLSENEVQKATFAAGCFWGVEKTFYELPGVVFTRVGYTGGQTESPTYSSVCGGKTGHAESVEVLFDPSKVTYAELLDTFWHCHNPTSGNRQGPDIGHQYRSVIFCHSDEQMSEANASKVAFAIKEQLTVPITTEIILATTFYEAEDYHQQYFLKHR